MLKNKLKAILLISLIMIFLLTVQIEAFDLGGKLEVGGGLFYSDNDLFVHFSNQAEFELYLPSSTVVEPRLVFQTALIDNGMKADIKYAYLRRRMEQGHLTIGRQPVSWSYGAMINFLDYGFALDGLGDQTVTPGIDGLRYQHYLGSGNTLQLLASTPASTGEELTDLGYGARLRLPGGDYDLSFNLLYQPVSNNNLLRVGTTYNKDIGDLGTYGSLGYFYLAEQGKDDLILQLGIDYSWLVGEYERRQIVLQAEYIRFLADDLEFSLINDLQLRSGDDLTEDMNMTGLNLAQDLLALNLVMQVDYFSNLGLALIAESNNQTLILAPYYTTDLGGDVELRIDGTLRAGGDLYPGISSKLSYYF